MQQDKYDRWVEKKSIAIADSLGLPGQKAYSVLPTDKPSMLMIACHCMAAHAVLLLLG